MRTLILFIVLTAIGCDIDRRNEASSQKYYVYLSDDNLLSTSESLLLTQQLLECRDQLQSIDYNSLSIENQEIYNHIAGECNYFIQDRYVYEDTITIKATDHPSKNKVFSTLAHYRHNYTYTPEQKKTISSINVDYSSAQAGSYQIGVYYSTEDFNMDSTLFYLKKTVDLAPSNTLYHMEALRWLSILGIVNRDDLASKRYILQLEDIVNKYYPEDDLLNCRIQYLKGYIFWRNKDYSGKKLCINSLSILDSDTCTKEIQEAYKFSIYVMRDSKDTLLQTQQVSDLATIVQQCGDYANYYKQLGELNQINNDLDAAAVSLEKAFEFIVNSKPFNDLQFGSLVDGLYYAYLDTEQFDKAFDLIYSTAIPSDYDEIQQYDESKIYNSKNQFYYFITLGYYIEIYYSRYQSFKNINDLYAIEKILLEADQLIQQEYFTLDEQVLLSINVSSSLIYDIGLQAHTELYNLTSNQDHLAQAFHWSNKNKAKIQRRDQALLNQNTTNSKSHDKEKIYRKKIIEFGLDQTQTDSLAYYQGQLKSLVKFDRTIFDNTVTDISAIQNTLSSDEQWIDQNLIGNQLIQITLEKESTNIISKQLSPEQLHRIKSYVLNDSITQLKQTEIFEDIPLNKNITISKDEELHNINYSSLLDKNNLPIIFDHRFSYTSSLSNLILAKENDSRNTSDKVAGIFYTDRSTIGNLPDRLPELSGNLIEAKAIKSKFPLATIHTGPDCTKSKLDQLLQSDLNLLHIGLHGKGSALDITDLELYFRSEKGIDTLKAYQLLSYSNMPKTVILSACESSKGINQRGEGCYDIARYFISAGSDHVISSIVELDDNTAQSISKHFLQHISEGMKIEEAFYEAQKKTAQFNSEEMNWAAMVMYR